MPPDPDDLDLDLASFERLRGVLSRVDVADSELVDPPEDLWGRIAAAIETTPEQESPKSSPQPRAAHAEVVVLADRRRTGWVLAAAAAVIVVAGIVGGIVATRGSSPSGTVVASASLQPLEGSATAQAKLVRSGGRLRLQLIAHQMSAAPPGQYYELWLMDRSITIPVSLGSMTGSTTVTIPAGVDTTKFPVVDISLQPNGHPAYSGHSVLRGTLA